MASSLNFSTTFNSRVDALTLGGGSSTNLTTTSSNAVGETTTLNPSTYTQLSLGSLTDVCALYLYNDNTVYSASVILVSTGSLGQNHIAKLSPGQSAVIPWSGSLSGLYAKSVSATDLAAVIQHIAQQA